jgi:RHS repeat-associated protein
MQLIGRKYTQINSGYRYGFNGKEKDIDIANDNYDYGARIYDCRSGRWLSADGLANKYPDVSPYIYALNTPLQGKDPDGNVVIFINGQHTGQGGQAIYWGGYDKRAMDRIGDHSARYVDGALGGFKNTFAPTPINSPSPFPAIDYIIKRFTSTNLNKKVRITAGEAQGMRDAESIISNLSEGETIKIVAHSMGNAFSRGYVNGIIKYAKEHGLENKIKGKFQYELDVSPFQGAGLPANPNVQTTETQVGGLDGGSINGVRKKGVAGSVPTVAPIPGVKNISSKSDADKGHAISELSTDNIKNSDNAGTETKKPIEQGVDNSKTP